MKIAIDLRPLQVGHQDRGIGSYILNILKEIPTENTEYIILRYSKSDPVKDYSINFGKNYKDVVVVHNKFGRSPKELFLYIKDLVFPVHNKLRVYRPNIFIQFDYLFGAPRLLNCKTYVVAYDLIPFKLKNFYLPSWKKFIYFRQFRIRSRLRLSVRAYFYEHKYRKALKFLRRANGVISISNCTTKDLIEIAKVKSKNINTIYLAASFRESEKDLILRDNIKNLVDDNDGNFITFIGGTDKRRQVTELISAFNLYNARQNPLVLLLGGNEFTHDSDKINPHAKLAIENSSYKDRIHMLGKISEREKKYILEHAKAFVYPTLYEGFGLPVLEAMSVGCPVITYDNSSIREIARETVIYSKEGNYNLYTTMTEKLNEKSTIKDIVKAGKIRSKDFDWNFTRSGFWKTVLNK